MQYIQVLSHSKREDTISFKDALVAVVFVAIIIVSTIAIV